MVIASDLNQTLQDQLASLIDARQASIAAALARQERGGETLDNARLDSDTADCATPPRDGLQIGATYWHLDTLDALAEELGLGDQTLASLVHLCIQRRWLTPPVRSSRDEERAAAVAVVRVVLREHAFITHRQQALLSAQLCRDEASAAKAAGFLTRQFVPTARDLTVNLIRSYERLGPYGLLKHALLPIADVLLAVEQRLYQSSEISPETLNQVRADVIAIYAAVHETHAPAWHEHLLFEPPASFNRTQFKRRFGSLAGRIAERVVATQGWPLERAALLVQAWLTHGLTGILALHLSEDQGDALRRWSQQQLDRLLDHATAGLPADLRALVTQRALRIAALFAEMELPIPFRPLLNERVASRRRRLLSRRFALSVANIVRRRHARRKAWRLRSKQRAVPNVQPDTASKRPATELDKAVEQRLVERLSVAEHTTKSEAANVIRELLTYGAYGLIPKFERSRVVDARIYELLQLYKWGHLPGTRHWPEVMQRVRAYAADLGTALPSDDMIRALYQSLAVPSYWYSGKGRAVETVSLSGSLSLPNRKCLHARWLVVPMRLSKRAVHELSSDRAALQLIMVFDEAAQHPVGYWVTDQEVAGQDVALALYQAIWQPNAPLLPLHGIPERVVIEAQLVEGHKVSLERALSLLCSGAEYVTKVSVAGYPLLQRWQRDIRASLLPTLQVMERTAYWQSQALRATGEWLTKTCFPQHSYAPVPTALREQSVVMPGHQTPGAGWLLPVIATGVIADDGSINVAGKTFGAGRLLIGERVAVRTMPFYYPERDAGVFLERIDFPASELCFAVSE